MEFMPLEDKMLLFISLKKGLKIKYFDPTHLSNASPQVIEKLGKQSYFRQKIHKYEKLYASHCIKKNAKAFTKAFLSAGMNVDAKCGACLYKAIYEDDVELVSILLANGANVNPQLSCDTGYSRSPLQKALDQNRKIEIVNMLIKAGGQ